MDDEPSPFRWNFERITDTGARFAAAKDGAWVKASDHDIITQGLKDRIAELEASLAGMWHAEKTEAWFAYVPDGAICATEGCGKPASVHFVRGDVGSYYCKECYLKVQAVRNA